MLHDVAPMVEFQSEIERLWVVKRLRQSRFAWRHLRQKALWVASGNGDGRAEKLRYDVMQGVLNTWCKKPVRV